MAVTEITSGWNLNIGIVESTLTRVFIDDGNNSTGSYKNDIPKIGDSYTGSNYGGFSLKGLRVDNISVTKEGDHPNKHRIIVRYTTRLSSSSSSADPRNWERSLQMGGEVVSIRNEDTGIYKWSDGEIINQNIPKTVSTGNFSITRRSIRDSISNELFLLIGKVNKKPFERFSIKTVLFEGINSVQYVNEEGDIRFRITFNFKYRYPSWNHLLRESTGEMELVEPELYESDDLNKLLRDSLV